MTIPSHLVYYSDDNPGITRKKWGRGFRYFDERKRPVSSPKKLERIKSMVIPPAWTNVWICPKVNGHLQCTGEDLKNRKQYIYHEDWLVYRQKQKFELLREFGQNLKDIRKNYQKEINAEGWPKNKVLALTICLLDNYYFRIGNRQYADMNGTYGLTTLRRRHVEDNERELVLKYTAKSGKPRNVEISDDRIAGLIREMSELPGYEIFRYQDEEGNFVPVDSSDVNDYLYELAGQRFTAKNFRTWGATRLTLEKYPEAVKALEENPRINFEPTLVKLVAEDLGNTVIVCREYYIHPGVLKFLESIQPASLDKKLTGKFRKDKYLSTCEKQLLKILDNQEHQ